MPVNRRFEDLETAASDPWDLIFVAFLTKKRAAFAVCADRHGYIVGYAPFA